MADIFEVICVAVCPQSVAETVILTSQHTLTLYHCKVWQCIKVTVCLSLSSTFIDSFEHSILIL